MYINYYAIPVIIASILMLALSIMIRPYRSVPGVRGFSMLMLSGAVYSLFYALEVSSDELSYVSLFYKLEYLGIPFIPAFFLLFAISYTRNPGFYRSYLMIPLFSVPVITLLLAFTFDYHNLFIRDWKMDIDGLFPAFIFTPGIWYWIHQGYSFTAIIISIILFLRLWLSSAPVFRRQTGIILTGSVVPFVVFVSYLAGLFPRGLDATPFSFAISGIIVFVGISRFRLFNLVPLARNMLFESIPNGVVVFDNYHRLVDFNRSSSALFGIRPSDTGKPVEDLFGDWPEVISFISRPLKSGGFQISRVRTGEALYLDCYVTDLKDKRIGGMGQMLLVHDVTAQRKTEIEKEESDEKFRIIFENAPLGIMYFDQNGFIELCNDYFIKILGSSQEKVIGMNMLHLSDRRMVNVVKKVFEGRRAVFEGEYTSETGNKTVFARAIFKPVLNKNKVVEGGLCIVENITARKVAEERIKKSNAELKRLNAEKDRFFSILAHDLRSPFSSFLGYTDILAESLETMTPELIQSIAVSMKESANNLYNLLENLLQWSRMQQGSVDYLPEKIQIKEGIIGCIEPLLTFSNNKLIDVSYDLPADLAVHADKKMFDTLIRNLFTNAVKFTNRQGSVVISATMAGDSFIDICFADDGIGMSPAMAGNLFRVDVKTSRTGTEGELSTGLGLILCREFIEMHGGRIWVESQEGIGSRFFVRLKKFGSD